MTSQTQMQLGKKGLTKEFLDDLKKRFEKSSVKNLKVTVLKSARESREDIKKYSEKIKTSLGPKYTTKIIGFSIFIKKWRKEMR
ncbi:hypothetical protein HOE04_00265 [archaeon]|jgi:RNA-binding protein YhbY|nr:hypothetical protein [archaeon]